MKKIREENSAFEAQKGRGRPKGKPNRATTEFRDTVRNLLEGNSENVAVWLQSVAEGDPTHDRKPDPYRALDLLAKLAEYAAPKLARTEHVGNADQPVEMKITWMK